MQEQQFGFDSLVAGVVLVADTLVKLVELVEGLVDYNFLVPVVNFADLQLHKPTFFVHAPCECKLQRVL